MQIVHYLILVFALMLSSSVLAGYGPLAIGYGTTSIAMAGADVAQASDTLAWNINPAGMATIVEPRFDAYLEPYYFSEAEYSDARQERQKSTPNAGAALGWGWARKPSSRSPLTFGGVLLAQGGVGFGYDNLLTKFDTRDELSVQFGVFRLAAGTAYRISEELSVGINASLNYSLAEQSVFPNTSVLSMDNPNESFFGLKIESLSGLSTSYRLGLNYAFSEQFMLGLSYAGKTKLKLENGQGTVNMTAVGLGNVHYTDASVRGQALPQELSIGLSWKPQSNWRIAADFGWLDWSSAFKQTNTALSHPNNATAPTRLAFESPTLWRDQYTFAIGTEYHSSPQWSWMAGITYARNPIPRETITPVFITLSETHFTVGFIHQIGKKWRVGSSFLYSPSVSLESQNTSLPLPEGGQMRFGVMDMTLSLSRSW